MKTRTTRITQVTRSLTAAIVGACALATSAGAAEQAQQPKAAIIVSRPAYAVTNLAVAPDYSHSGWGDAKRAISVAVGDMMTTELAAQGVQVVERARLKDILAEQSAGDSAIMDEKTAARIGELAGAGHMVLGTVTEFCVKSDSLDLG